MSERECCEVLEVGFKSLVTACSELVGGRKSLFPRGIRSVVKRCMCEGTCCYRTSCDRR